MGGVGGSCAPTEELRVWGGVLESAAAPSCTITEALRVCVAVGGWTGREDVRLLAGGRGGVRTFGSAEPARVWREEELGAGGRVRMGARGRVVGMEALRVWVGWVGLPGRLGTREGGRGSRGCASPE